MPHLTVRGKHLQPLRWSALVVLLAASGALAQQNPNIQVAGDLYVELSATDASAGTDLWVNTAPDSIGNFIKVGQPFTEIIANATGVTFNASPDVQDAYQCENPPPEGLVGLDPTRSIEAWVYNPAVADEETILSWGKRGGPDGSNMSFNYGVNANFGAVGHWGGAGPDLGWNDAGGAPAANRWHHLVYTYDGTTTRVYSDGCFISQADCEYNLENLGAGVINTFAEPLITLASQIEPDGTTLTGGLRGTLSIGRVRIHDGVLTAAQILNNYDVECTEFCPPPSTCVCENCPASDQHIRGKPVYERLLTISGIPAPDTITAVSPAGATITPQGLFRYTLPGAPPNSFNVRVECTNAQGTAAFVWTVTLVDPPVRANIDIAGELLVELCATHSSAGNALWLNSGSGPDFRKLGEPLLEAIGPEGNKAITFNTGATDDGYISVADAPDGIVGLNPTRSIEAWVYNPEVTDEETIVSWGHRGGPDGSNMSFNYGVHPLYGAVGHWGGNGPDIGWNNAGGSPEAGFWHHLVYTFDGDATATTRVYIDGILANSEVLGQNVINTYTGPIVVAAQLTDGFGGLDFGGGREGVLSIGKIRVHDGVLSGSQIFKNFNAEREEYGLPEPTTAPPTIDNAPDEQSFCNGATSYTFTVAASGVPPPTFELLSPPGATISATGVINYTIPAPSPASFNVSVRATNAVDSATASWTVTREDTSNTIAVAEELIVSLDARDPTAATEVWANAGSLGDFDRIGAPVITTKGGVKAVSFNEDGRGGEAYQSIEDAPEGVVGVDPTRSIEVWAWNDAITDEETLVSWGHRGGPAGTNMSFNYGTNAAYGAVGHWDAPDIGWGALPAAGAWHHLVYTFDGTTTRVYSDGVQTNSEVLGAGVLNTYTPNKVVIAAQIVDGAGTLDFGGGREGILAIARVRVHDGVLSPCEVFSNYELEKNDFLPPPCPTPGNPEYQDTHCTGITVEEVPRGVVSHRVTATGTDDTGDPVRYTFTATDGATVQVRGPQAQNVANFTYRNAVGPVVFTVTVTDRLDCDDLAADAVCKFPPDVGGTNFHRGDADNNGQLQLTDAVRILGFLFLGQQPPSCIDAADADDNGQLQLTDAVRILGFLFLGQAPPAPPGPPGDPCGTDANAEDPDLGCVEYTNC